ncbi:hypothetical protein ACN38_g9587 [Penicillium nordicum]|uniref:Uncharacterized protein n=1 Tax=Penicillium nordicum TaxID=229535 RepID=A0A0M8NUB4_9EURO|nr:hypothetical protein ACN38_g9587 [Penicillium nordicum]
MMFHPEANHRSAFLSHRSTSRPIKLLGVVMFWNRSKFFFWGVPRTPASDTASQDNPQDKTAGYIREIRNVRLGGQKKQTSKHEG